MSASSMQLACQHNSVNYSCMHVDSYLVYVELLVVYGSRIQGKTFLKNRKIKKKYQNFAKCIDVACILNIDHKGHWWIEES